MKHKVSELEGALLDAAVAKAEGWSIFRNKRHGFTFRAPDALSDEIGNNPPKFDSETGLPVQPISLQEAVEALGALSWTTDWAQGGPIIHRELIDVSAPDYNSDDKRWFAGMYSFETPGRGRVIIEARGATPLIAAMRAYVASKLGEEVELP